MAHHQSLQQVHRIQPQDEWRMPIPIHRPHRIENKSYSQGCVHDPCEEASSDGTSSFPPTW
eukprot:3206409-Amphidinium_carterae.1